MEVVQHLHQVLIVVVQVEVVVQLIFEVLVLLQLAQEQKDKEMMEEMDKIPMLLVAVGDIHQ